MPSQSTGKSTTVYLDFKDLFDYAQVNSTLSGIQRVVANLAKQIKSWVADNPSFSVALAIPDYETTVLYVVDLDATLAMIDIIENQQSARAHLDNAIRRVRASRRPAFPSAGDIYVMAGAFWICDNFVMMAQMRQRGVLFSIFIHDLIQINFPQFVHDAANLKFRQSLIDALTSAHFVTTNSHFVAGDVTRFLQEKLNFSIPVEAVPLATELPEIKRSSDPVDPRAVELAQSEFVLCVGTIEIRKNHMFLIRIWERLLKEFGADIPNLVFVGKWGWNIDELREYVRHSDLDGHLHIFVESSDVTLDYFYETCLMTAYPSFAEGFGLPIGESLGHGKPCIASNTTSLPEVGGDFARYVDPRDVDQGYEIFRSVLADRAALAAWTERIKTQYRPKTWPAFATQFYDTTAALAGQTRRSALETNCLLEPRVRYRVDNGEALRLDLAGQRLVTMRMACVAGWHHFEDWGCWAEKPDAEVRFRTDQAAGTTIILSLNLRAPPGSSGAVCRVKAGRPPLTLRLSSSFKTFVVAAEVQQHGMVNITLESIGTFGRPDNRFLYVGLQSMAWCMASDTTARLEYNWEAMKTVVTARIGGTITGLRPAGSNKGRSREKDTQMIHEMFDQRDREALDKPRVGFVSPVYGLTGRSALMLPVPSVALLDGPYMASSVCQASDLLHRRYVAFCKAIRHSPNLHRHLWQMAFVAEHLEQAGVLLRGATGLAIGGPYNELSLYFGQLGCKIKSVRDLSGAEVPSRSSDIGSEQAYEFCWSQGEMSKTSSFDRTLDFLEDSLKRLRSGGVACHTAHFNISANDPDVEPTTVGHFRRCDLEAMTAHLEKMGHTVKALPIQIGTTFLDSLVDPPPYSGPIHLKVQEEGVITTAFGIVVSRRM